MKNILSIAFFAFLTIGLVSCDSKKMSTNEADVSTETSSNSSNQLDINNSDVQEAMANTTIDLNEMTHDFGTINEGDVVSTTFTVTNTGKNPLIINDAKGSCGCTTPNISSFKNKPIAPGESRDIEVQFDSKGKPNVQRKTVKLMGNFEPNPTVLNIQANVTPKAQ